jgi:phosphatidate cytidylyltransferase
VRKDLDSVAMAPGLKAVKFSRDWITRPVFAVLLASAITFAIFKGAPYLEIAAAFFALSAIREWHRMVGKGRFLVEATVNALVICLALAAFLLWTDLFIPPLILGAGTALVFAIAAVRRNNPLWHAGGVIYLGLPALCIIAIRDLVPHGHGAWVLVGVFLIVWATDTGALFCGNLIGGPKLAPVLSPNKTWAGFVGGVVSAAAIETIFLLILKGNLDLRLALWGTIFGGGMAIVAHLGDLFESWAKRCFHVKDSGSMIPGHGGVLDRIDSTLATLVALAVLVLLLKLDPLFGAIS